MSFPRYPKYKDSGVEWLGQVPEHWAVTPLKYAASFASGGTPSKTRVDYWDGDIPWASSKDLKSDNLADTIDHITRTAVADGAQLIDVGDLMVVVRGMILAHSFPVTKALVRMAINQDLKGIRPRPSWVVDYFANVLRAASPETFRRLDEAGHGTKALRMEAWLGMVLPHPPLPEQTAIAAFLDRETAKIDALVTEQERLIELLKEKRQAVISHAVTKGLNPDAPMKDSGVEWLGEIPAHWEVSPCQRLARPGTSITYGIVQAGPHCEDGIPYIRTSDMSGSTLREGEYLRTTKEIDASYARSRVREGDLIVAIRASVGKGLLVPAFLDGANLTQGTAKISPGPKLIPRFLFLAFNSDYCQQSIRVVAKGSTFLEITLDSLRRIQLAVPPCDEQTKIAAFLDAEMVRYDTLTTEAQRSIELLQERRSALISAAVTGQIDVRDVERRAA